MNKVMDAIALWSEITVILYKIFLSDLQKFIGDIFYLKLCLDFTEMA